MRYLRLLLLTILIAPQARAIDWDVEPSLSDTTATVVSEFKERDENLAIMDFTGDTNLPTGTIRFNNSTDRIERWNGASWDSKLADYTSHLTDTANPHSVTATQVGNTTAQWNADQLQGTDVVITSIGDNEALVYDSSSGDWINQTAAEAGYATAANLTSHTGDTGNPHSVTAAQASAAATANNLSDLASASTARTNLGLGTMATQASTAVNIDGGTIDGITDLAVVDGGTGASSAATARSNLSCAVSGSNSDITALTDISQVQDNNDVTILGGTDATGSVYIGDSGVGKWVYAAGFFRPTTTLAYNIGSGSYIVNGFVVQRIDFRGTQGTGTDDPTTDAPVDWIEVQIAGVTRYIPVYD